MYLAIVPGIMYGKLYAALSILLIESSQRFSLHRPINRKIMSQFLVTLLANRITRTALAHAVNRVVGALQHSQTSFLTDVFQRIFIVP